ncbi:MAG TPA: hypothetical protein VM243_03005 [Phycisphaerae bacterium]|nr:hypothetical protein [Phycisphaerae bacterium]
MSADATPTPATFSRRDERGTFIEIINRGPWETVITGEMSSGAIIGNHYHKITELFFFLTGGHCRVDIECIRTGRRRHVPLSAGRGVHLHTFEAHAIRFSAPSTFILLKSHAFDPEQPDTYDHPVRTVETQPAAAT